MNVGQRMHEALNEVFTHGGKLLWRNPDGSYSIQVLWPMVGYAGWRP